MVATRGRTFKRPWRGSCHSSKLKSSSAPIGRKDSWCFHGVGSSNAPLLGSTAAEGLQRIGRTSIATRWRFCGLPQSASCSENFVIPPDVFGQTLRGFVNFVWSLSRFSVASSPARDLLFSASIPVRRRANRGARTRVSTSRAFRQVRHGPCISDRPQLPRQALVGPRSSHRTENRADPEFTQR